MTLRPCDGLTILDLTQVASGPYGTMLLADAGATVIKVERPGSGDPSRGLPPFVRSESGETVAAGIVRFGRNKRFVSLNLQSPEGRDVLLRLAAKADALWENYVPGTMDRLGLGDDALRAANPRLIHVAISGYGSGVAAPAPYAQRPALDIIAQAASGVMDVSGEGGGPPAQVGAVIGDLIPGLYATIAMLFALRLRDRDGLGRFVEVAMVDALTALNERAVMAHGLTGTTVTRGALGHAGPYGRFAAQDGDVVIGASIPNLWERLAKAVGAEPLLAQAPNADPTGTWWRMGDLLRPAITAWIGARTAADCVDTLNAAGVPCAKVLNVAEVIGSDHTAARRLLLEVPHPAGSVAMVGWPMKIEGLPEPPAGPIKAVGADTDDVLSSVLGMDSAAIDRLRAAKVV